MSIESLRLKGFKSFGTSCEFVFAKGFNAVVGPNGSGKSNVLDALRWILGEGSPTTLRIVRQNDLLFQGSATVMPSKEAEVVLTLSDEAGKLYLRRQYTAEGGSVIHSDGVRIRLQDLTEIKSRFMLEGDTFAFIGQGEVSEAIHQRPMQRRHHLELLFGIDRYRKKRDDTYVRLESSLTEAQRINTLISELENRREEIAPEVTVAVEAQGILDNLENVRQDFYFSRRFNLEKRGKELRMQQQLLSEHENIASEWRDLWGKAVLAAEEKLRGEGFDERLYTDREQALTAQREALRRQGFAASTRVKTILSDRRELKAELLRLTSDISSVRDELLKMRSEEAEHQKDSERERAALESVLSELEAGRASLERERMRRQAMQDERAEKALFCSKADARLRALVSSINDGTSEKARLEAEKLQLADDIVSQRSKIAELETSLGVLSADYTNIYSLCQKSAAAIQQLRREKTRQEAELDVLKENTEGSVYPEPVRILLSAARLGRMQSRPEVATEAFSCPPHVAPALEAYLGGRQFWLLVKTFDEAQEGIELLKQRRGGRVTYLPLERCRPRFPDAHFRLPLKGVTGWGLDLITLRSPWEPAVQHLLGDLLVVETYPLGAELVKSGARFPIVTLDGEVFAPSGTVSGGKMRTGGGAISHNQQVSDISVAIGELGRRISILDADLKAAEEQERKAAQEKEDVNSRLLRLKDENTASMRAFSSLEAALNRAGDEGVAAKTEIDSLSVQLRIAGARLKELELELAALPALPDSEDSSSRISAMKTSVQLAEERLKGSRNVILRIEKELDTLQARSLAIAKELKDGETDEAEQRAVLSGVWRSYLEIRREESALKVALEDERNRLRRAHTRLERLRARSRKAVEAVSNIQAESAALGERISSLSAELEQLKDLWDDKYPYDQGKAAKIEGGKDLTGTLRRLERDLKALGPYNLGALSEDTSLIERIDFLSEQLEDVRNAVDELKRLIADTDAQVEAIFSRAMADIDVRFNALFQRLFAGGEARLTLQDEGNIWERGVEIYARPPGKRLQNISQLSGGEQSLTAIAHLFAALEVAKMPLAVLDEVDAALDEYNLIRFADLAREYSRSLQLIVMTHRRTTMERADVIFGVTMVEPGLSRIVGIDVASYQAHGS